MSKSIYVYDKVELEYRVNKYNIRFMWIMIACMGVIWLANILDVFIVEQRLMAHGAAASILSLLITLIILRYVDLKKAWVKYFAVFVIVFAISAVSMALTYHTVLLFVIPVMVAAQYFNKRVIVYAYALSIVGMLISTMLGFEYGLCDANMLLLTVKPTEYYADMLTNGASTILLNDNPWATIPLFYVLPRSIILFLLLPIIQTICANILGYTEYAADMKRRSELDDMTGLYNKNKYLDMIANHYPKVENICVIFWDVNNLKDTNDSLGHEKGDYLIKVVGDCLSRLSNAKSKSYRIGGDEFVMVVENPERDEIEQMLDRWDNMIGISNQLSDIPCSVAVGMASGSGKNIEKLAKEADKKMYQKKEEQKA